jgi:hypothetical protein
MGFLRRLLGRERDHDKWLADHPGKDSKKSAPLAVDEEEQARVREHMEQDLQEARDERGSK